MSTTASAFIVKQRSATGCFEKANACNNGALLTSVLMTLMKFVDGTADKALASGPGKDMSVAKAFWNMNVWPVDNGMLGFCCCIRVIMTT